MRFAGGQCGTSIARQTLCANIASPISWRVRA